MLKEEFHYHTLPSGIRCILKRIKSPVIYCSLTIGAGSREESESEHGIAHLIEHTMFKGTARRSSYHINTLLDNVGGEINAYTTKEETVIHTVTLKRDLRKAVDMIADVAFNSTYNQGDIDKEVNVIIDEINSYKDSPSELIFDEFEELIFKGSSLGRSILGSKRQLSRLRTDDIKQFIRNNHNTDKMVFAIIGDITNSRFEQLCNSYLGDIEPNQSIDRRTVPVVTAANSVTINKRTYQTHSIIGCRAYPHSSDKRVATVLALNILGGASANSRLNLLLRERYALTYNVEASYTAYQDCGVASIYFSCEKGNLNRATSLIHQEIERMQREPLTDTQLRKAKNQLIGQLTIGAESAEAYMLSCAKSYLMFNSVDSPARINEVINGITSADITDVMNEIFAKESIYSLTYA